MIRTLWAALAVVASICAVSPASALTCNNDGRCVDSSPDVVGHIVNRATRQTMRFVNDVATQYLPHPAGCPRRAFCGCGAAVETFGRPLRELWLVRAWYKFPRSAPAPQMAAVRPHHVFILKRQIAGNNWLVVDHNSGGRKSRLHVRSIAGFTIVNPRA